MATDEFNDTALERLDSAVEEWFVSDEVLLDAMDYALKCNVSRDEVARRVTVNSRPTVPSALALIDRRDEISRVLGDAGVSVLTSDDTEEVWLFLTSKPRRGVTIEHSMDSIGAGAPGTPGRAATTERVAAKVVAILYDAGFELASGTTRLTRDAAITAFADPDARLQIEEAPKPGG
ncbi:hypothetical protein [Nocardia sp. CNY236]|uniref:hypothetical protein n=1 Tax=Nocardia sp. CNY236 TaxID=1169152 RepID=UPI00041B9432|nr:hypothetical protein [Nocardia sp. CNY236]